jgi:hypothetical protein
VGKFPEVDFLRILVILDPPFYTVTKRDEQIKKKTIRKKEKTNITAVPSESNRFISFN